MRCEKGCTTSNWIFPPVFVLSHFALRLWLRYSKSTQQKSRTQHLQVKKLRRVSGSCGTPFFGWGCLSNNTMKELVWSDSFWMAVKNVLPQKCHGLVVEVEGLQLEAPLHQYIDMFLPLAKQLLTHKPENVACRPVDCHNLHVFYCSLGSSC
jgi:hypothetical protein